MKYMWQVTRDLYHMLRVSDYYVMYRQLCEMSVKVTKCVTNPFRCFSEKFVIRGRPFLRLPLPFNGSTLY